MRTRHLSILAAVAAALSVAAPAGAQTVIGGRNDDSVFVDRGVLEQLGPPRTLPQLMIKEPPQREAAPAKPAEPRITLTPPSAPKAPKAVKPAKTRTAKARPARLQDKPAPQPKPAVPTAVAEKAPPAAKPAAPEPAPEIKTAATDLPASVETKAAESEAAESKLAETKATETKAAETKAAEAVERTTALEPAAVEPAPVAARPVEAAPAASVGAPEPAAPAAPAPTPARLAAAEPAEPASAPKAVAAAAVAPRPEAPPPPAETKIAAAVTPPPPVPGEPRGLVPPKIADSPKPKVQPLKPASIATSVVKPGVVETDGALSVRFAGGAADLPTDAHGPLEALAERMDKDQALYVQLMAYAEGSDTEASKARRLSLSRALAVRSYLMNYGVRSTRIEVRALGNRVPDGPGDRVDLVVEKR